MAESLVDYWRFRDRFAEVLDPQLYPIEWLDVQVATGKMRLFFDGDSAILASVKTYPTGWKELEGQIATGNLAAVRSKLIPQAIDWAKSIGCKSAVIQSREGWAKVMKQDGFETYQTAIRKAI